MCRMKTGANVSKKNQYWTAIFGICAVLIAVFAVATVAYPEQSQEQRSNNAAVGPPERFATIMERMKADKPAIMERQMDLLNARYDLSDRPRPCGRFRRPLSVSFWRALESGHCRCPRAARACHQGLSPHRFCGTSF